MKILILSVTAGQGHNSTATALLEGLQSRGATVVIEDLFQQVGTVAYQIVDKGYLFSVRHLTRQFKLAYNSLERSENMRRAMIALTLNNRFSRKYASYINEFAPDIIVCTHVFSATVMDSLIGQGRLSIPVIGINTDYCLHPFWEDLKNIDYIVTGSELLSSAAIKRGVPESIILPLGIPVRPGFSEREDPISARQRLEIDTGKKTIILMGGSMGHGNFLNALANLETLNMDLQVICICGNNEKLVGKLRNLNTKLLLHIRGFVNNIGTYMDAADCAITKPGGLTVTELMCKQIPMILVNPIPGHEERNVSFLVNNGAAMYTDKNFSVADAVYYIFSMPERLELMKKSLELISHPDASDKICEKILSLGAGSEAQQGNDDNS